MGDASTFATTRLFCYCQFEPFDEVEIILTTNDMTVRYQVHFDLLN